ncbi:MAG TPA: hypothetical protein VN775_07935 [Opitutaceae bacterium]|nr:hypothetical protein [Opitutaceae bacterium]
MCASLSDFLRASPPPPRVAVLPDAVFFSRTVSLAAGTPRAEVVSQVGLALEALSPFPLAQLYFGYYLPPGADRVLAFASYRRRFTAEQLAEWAGAEYVLPAFAAILGCGAEPATTVVLAAPDGLTAVHWDQGPVPAVVLYHPLKPDATEDERARARAELIRSAGEARTIVDAPSPPVPQPGRSEGEVVFQAGGLRSRLPSAVAAALDVRDKADLDALARARRRDLFLWRTAIGALAACLLFAAGELALLGAGLWQSARIAKVAAQRPTVARIMEEKDLAGRIDELSTKRLLPLEMISVVSPEVAMPKNPPAIQFLRAAASAGAVNTIQIDAQTSNAGEIAAYRTAIEQTPGCERVEIRDQRTQNNVVSFKLIVTFKPGALAPATS